MSSLINLLGYQWLTLHLLLKTMLDRQMQLASHMSERYIQHSGKSFLHYRLNPGSIHSESFAQATQQQAKCLSALK